MKKILCCLFFLCHSMTFAISVNDLTQPKTLISFITGWFSAQYSSLQEKGSKAAQQSSQRIEYLLFGQFRRSYNKSNRHRKDKVRVDTQRAVPDAEKKYIDERMSKVALKALRKLLDDDTLTEQTAPRIALMGSGGGIRASLGTLGGAMGAHDIGLLDSALYFGGLSGSSWFLVPWAFGNVSLDELKNTYFKNYLKNGLQPVVGKDQITYIYDQLLKKFIFEQPLSSIDLFGAILANNLLKMMGSKRHLATLSQTTLNGVQYPYPVVVAVRPLSLEPDRINSYEWWEFTKDMVGTFDIDKKKASFVPSWSFGSRFAKGVTRFVGPEQNLGMIMGVSGSAFTASIKDVAPELQEQLRAVSSQMSSEVIDFWPEAIRDMIPWVFDVPRQLKQVIDGIANFRVSPATFNNFTPLIKKKTIQLLDAGLAINIPAPPLMRPERKIDVMVMFDSSKEIVGAPQLRRLSEFARSRGLPFPKIDFEKAESQLVSVFDDKKDGTPVVIYIPLVKNPDFNKDFDVEECKKSGPCGTFNFNYTSEDVDLLTGLMTFTVKQHADQIKDAIKVVAKRKKDSSKSWWDWTADTVKEFFEGQENNQN